MPSSIDFYKGFFYMSFCTDLLKPLNFLRGKNTPVFSYDNCVVVLFSWQLRIESSVGMKINLLFAVIYLFLSSNTAVQWQNQVCPNLAKFDIMLWNRFQGAKEMDISYVFII